MFLDIIKKSFCRHLASIPQFEKQTPCDKKSSGIFDPLLTFGQGYFFDGYKKPSINFHQNFLQMVAKVVAKIDI